MQKKSQLYLLQAPENWISMRMMYYSVMTQAAYSEKEIPSSPNRIRTYDLPITSSDALPLSYRRLVGAKAIKLGLFLSPCVMINASNTVKVTIKDRLLP